MVFASLIASVGIFGFIGVPGTIITLEVSHECPKYYPYVNGGENVTRYDKVDNVDINVQLYIENMPLITIRYESTLLTLLHKG